MARKARRRCRCGEGREKDVGLDRREEDADVARGAEKMPMQGPETAARVPAAGQKGVEKKGTSDISKKI